MSSDAFAYNSQARFCSPDSYEPGCGAFDKREVPLLLLNIRATRPTHSCINLMRHYEERFGRDIRLSDSYLIRSVVAHMEMSFESATRLSTRVVADSQLEGMASCRRHALLSWRRHSPMEATPLWWKQSFAALRRTSCSSSTCSTSYTNVTSLITRRPDCWDSHSRSSDRRLARVPA